MGKEKCEESKTLGREGRERERERVLTLGREGRERESINQNSHIYYIYLKNLK